MPLPRRPWRWPDDGGGDAAPTTSPAAAPIQRHHRARIDGRRGIDGSRRPGCSASAAPASAPTSSTRRRLLSPRLSWRRHSLRVKPPRIRRGRRRDRRRAVVPDWPAAAAAKSSLPQLPRRRARRRPGERPPRSVVRASAQPSRRSLERLRDAGRYGRDHPPIRRHGGSTSTYKPCREMPARARARSALLGARRSCRPPGAASATPLPSMPKQPLSGGIPLGSPSWAASC